ncbi:MAG: hypothetical protein IJ583_15190 [Firmicutes bacterium]|nr:hypothetical protein [Bacillota bacterium]
MSREKHKRKNSQRKVNTTYIIVMSSKNGNDTPTKIAFITAIITLIGAIITLIAKMIG